MASGAASQLWAELPPLGGCHSEALKDGPTGSDATVAVGRSDETHEATTTKNTHTVGRRRSTRTHTQKDVRKTEFKGVIREV